MIIRDDGMLVSATMSARDAAFSRLVDERLDRSYRLARLILRNGADAEDATHDAVVTAWRSWHRLRDESRFDAWFARILVNACRDRLRRQARRRPSGMDPNELPAEGTDLAAVESRHDLEVAFAALSPDQRIAVVLRYWADLPVAAIAERVNAPAGTVKSRLHHAVRQLRVALASSEEPR